MSSNNNFSVRVEGLSKRYLIPHRQELTGRMDKLAAHMREFFPFMGRDEQDFFWALRDLSFEVKPGEVLGIVGRNGSGKSTLLKILSGVSQPSSGRALIRGRVGSLLEVGTGFHPDLTGRENVFMSGVLLGIDKREIAAKFDEIVDFSGVEAFIDVPVKRYSSGMYVRLAYAVTSMLRADVLILDEVMAVGDAEFREKSQRNIEKLARDGRSILFVSHNARAVRSICTRGIILNHGKLVFEGSSSETVVRYMQEMHHRDDKQLAAQDACHWDLSGAARMQDGEKRVINWVSTHKLDGSPCNKFETGCGMIIRIGFQNANVKYPYFSILIHNEFSERVATIHSTHDSSASIDAVDGVIECRVDQLQLGEGEYWLMLDFGNYGGHRAAMVSMDCVPSAASIHISLNGYLAGVGLDAFQGAAHRSSWSCVENARGVS